MPLIQTQISVVAQEQLSKQLELLQSFSNTAFQGLEKMIALNFATIKDTVEKVTASSRQVLASGGPQELLALAQTQRQPQIDSLLAYGKELATISSATREAFLNLANAGKNNLISVKITNTEALPVVAEKSLNASPVSKKTVSPVKIKSSASAKQISLLPEPDVKVSASKKAVSLPPAETKKTSVATSKTKTVAKVAAKSVSTKVVPATPAKTAVPATRAPAPKASKKALATKATTAQAAAKSAKAEVQKTIPATAPAASTTPVQIKEVTAVNTANTTAEASPKTAVPEKKSAVKFPFPPTKNLQGDKPAFPQAGGRPAYKGKASPATGAKKRVRQ
ncbi:TIGR01841 family phasin [Undibacterium sp. 14-3-2]|uniref:phasin family protein n=1 Tax=Undibacterium sp. 14-3-2 TaxID=2800129 RepID=UPI0019063ECA|nr:phasin family protein [Undibacterium sp. 14-3-2]MBK1890659.1 TIGR01841 family phasin [Undibacterium sp. 14-3-2]